MARPRELQAFYEGWADQQAQLLNSIRPLSLEQMQLAAAPGEWAIWQLGANMAGGRLYWLCTMLGEDDHGLRSMFRVDHATVPGVSLEWAGWEDNEDRPRTADEIEDAFLKTWDIIQGCLDRWTPADLTVEVTATSAFGQTMTITPAWVLWRLMAHEVHHGSEISLILRVHGLPTSTQYVNPGPLSATESLLRRAGKTADNNRRAGVRTNSRARLAAHSSVCRSAMNRQILLGALPLLVALGAFSLTGCGGDDDDAQSPLATATSESTATDGGDDDDDSGDGNPGEAGTIEVIIGNETFDFVTAPPQRMDFDGSTYGSCTALFGSIQASGYAADGSGVVVAIQITEPGKTGSWVTVKDGSEFFDGDGDATFLWKSNRANFDEGDPRYSEVMEDRQVEGSTASGSATFVDLAAETPEQVAGSFKVNCPE